MKKLYKAALLAAFSLGGVIAAQAQANPNDLLVGFTDTAGGVTNDYIVDLGQIPGTENTSLDVSGFDDSTFTSIFGSALSGGQVNVGIVAGESSPGQDVIMSVLDNGTGTPTVAGSSAPSTTPTGNNINLGASTVGALLLGVQPQVSDASWYYNIAENPATEGSAGNNSFAGYLNSNPMTTINGMTESLTLDLYEDVNNGRSGTTGWTYVGDVALDLNGGTLSATFDPVPEPSTYGLLSTGGLLLLAVRRLIGPKSA